MKYYETSFDNYLYTLDKLNFHTKVSFNADASDYISSLQNYIVYGPKACGKYSQVLYFLRNYSSKDLKYERKILHTGSKSNFTFKASDIHYEIDMALLGCNAKQLWNELCKQLKVIRISPLRSWCYCLPNFHETPVELLTLFYSYIQKVHYLDITVRFIFITESISFLPVSIKRNCNIVCIPCPPVTKVKKWFKLKPNDKISEKADLKNNYVLAKKEANEVSLLNLDFFVEILKNPNKQDFSLLREKLYDIITNNIEVNFFERGSICLNQRRGDTARKS